MSDPQKYFSNNRDKAKVFFRVVLSRQDVGKVIFSSTAAVYGEPAGDAPITEDCAGLPINPYGRSKLDAELALRAIPGISSVILRYFNVAGGAPQSGLGEAHYPETHLLPRLVLSLLDVPEDIQRESLAWEKRSRCLARITIPGMGRPSAIICMFWISLKLMFWRSNIYLMAGQAGFSIWARAVDIPVWEIVRAASRGVGAPGFQAGVGRAKGQATLRALVASGRRAGSETLGSVGGAG